jgi:hypothetical protein
MSCKKGNQYCLKEPHAGDTDHIHNLDDALSRDKWLTDVGTMRRCQLGSAMHKLRGILYRMQDPDAETKENSCWEVKGFG